MVRSLSDMKRKLEDMTSHIIPQTKSSPVTAILKHVKGTEAWHRTKLRKNTQENVAMVKSEDAKIASYVKPERKLNERRMDADETLSSGSAPSMDGSDKAVKFTPFVEEICFQSPPCDAATASCKDAVLDILGLDNAATFEACQDTVVAAVCKARATKAQYPLVSIVPINDCGQCLTSSDVEDFSSECTDSLVQSVSCDVADMTEIEADVTEIPCGLGSVDVESAALQHTECSFAVLSV